MGTCQSLCQNNDENSVKKSELNLRAEITLSNINKSYLTDEQVTTRSSNPNSRNVRNSKKKQTVMYGQEMKNSLRKLKQEQFDQLINEIKLPTPKAQSIFKHNPNEFVFLKVIGRGTFAKVLLAKSKLTGDIYAIKEINKQFLIETETVDRVLKEKQILESFDHYFIVKLHFTFQDDIKLYMAFDYHNGGELFYHLQRRRRIDEATVLFYMLEIHAALVYIHSKNVVYRDLKPENIVLDNEGHIRLIDFGLAKAFWGTEKSTKSFCGTVEYLGHRLNSARSN